MSDSPEEIELLKRTEGEEDLENDSGPTRIIQADEWGRTYTQEFCDAIHEDDEQKLHELFSGYNWEDYLEGYWLV